MTSKWLDPNWYRYLWRRRLPFEAKAGLSLILIGLVLGGGYFAADQLASASAGTSSGAYIVQSTTITKIVTIRRNGRTVVKRYPVVHTVRLKAKVETVTDLRTVTTAGRTSIVPVVKIRYVPVTRTVSHDVTSFVRVNGKTRTIVTTKSVTRPVTVSRTQTQVVTNERTQTNNITNEHTNTVVTTRPVTTTVVSKPVTSTVVRTNDVTTTVVVTTTETLVRTQTETRTLPPSTTTVVVTETVTTTTPSGP